MMVSLVPNLRAMAVPAQDAQSVVVWGAVSGKSTVYENELPSQ
jgi:hypothetical protein